MYVCTLSVRFYVFVLYVCFVVVGMCDCQVAPCAMYVVVSCGVCVVCVCICVLLCMVVFFFFLICVHDVCCMCASVCSCVAVLCCV